MKVDYGGPRQTLHVVQWYLWLAIPARALPSMFDIRNVYDRLLHSALICYLYVCVNYAALYGVGLVMTLLVVISMELVNSVVQ